MRGLVLTIRFASELAMIAALSYWGFDAADGIAGWLLGLGAPATAIVAWGAFIAPKAARPVPIAIRLGIEFALFGAAVLGLLAADQPALAACLGVVAAVTSIVNAAQEPTAGATP